MVEKLSMMECRLDISTSHIEHIENLCIEVEMLDGEIMMRCFIYIFSTFP